MSLLPLSSYFHDQVENIARPMERMRWADEALYAAWLSQTYFYVCHTTRLLCLAALKTDVAERKAHYGYLHHLKGELGHDLSALKDLKSLGREIAEFKEFAPTRLLIRNQYHLLNEGRVAALSGYALMLECLSLRIIPHMLGELEAAGLNEATSFLKLHLDGDKDHAAKGFEALEHVPTSQREWVIQSLEDSSWLYVQMLEQVQQAARRAIPLLPVGARRAA